MNIHYTLTLQQYQEAVNLHYKTGTRPLFIALFLGLATFMMLVGTNFSNTREVINNILMTFFAISFYLLFTRMITTYKAKKLYEKSPILSKEVTLRISGKGIRHDKKNDAKTMDWEHFSKWKESDQFFLIYTQPYQFNVIPKSAMNTKEIKELNAYLEKYIPQN